MKFLPLRSVSFSTAVAIAILIAAMVVQSFLIFPVHKHGRADADSLLAGICSIQVLNGSRPLMFPGINRFGSLECYVDAAAYSLFGVSRGTQGLITLVYWLLFWVFIYLYLREAFGPRLSVAGLLFATFPPYQFLAASYLGYLPYWAAALWLAVFLERRKAHVLWFFAFGVLSGIALWCSILSLMIILPLALWLLLRRVLNSAAKVGITIAGMIVGSMPMWIFLMNGGLAKWLGDSEMHSAHAQRQILSNASYFIFTIIPWFLGNEKPDGHMLFSSAGLIVLVYVVAVLLVICFTFWPNARLRKHPELSSQLVLLGLVVLCCAGLFIFSSAASVRGWTVRYVTPMYLAAPGFACVLLAMLRKAELTLGMLVVALLTAMNLRDYPFPSSSTRKSMRAELVAEDQLIQFLKAKHIQAVLGGYWDVYGLNFDSDGTIVAVPLQAWSDYFGFGSSLASRKLKWALVDDLPDHLVAWEGRLHLSGSVERLATGRYVVIPSRSLPAKKFIHLARATWPTPRPPLNSFSELITSPVRHLEMKPGKTYVYTIHVTNAGTQTWFADGPSNWVDASYRWIDYRGRILPIEGNRAHLTRAEISPGGSDVLKLEVTAPPEPGSYTLCISMVQEGVAWFFQKGAKPLLVKVEVDPARSTASISPSAGGQLLR